MSKGTGNFAAILRVAIEKSGKSIPEIADLAGVTRQGVATIRYIQHVEDAKNDHANNRSKLQMHTEFDREP